MILLKSRFSDLKIISFYLGKVAVTIAIAMLIPLGFAIFFLEHAVVYDFIIGFSAAVSLGYFLIARCHTNDDLNWAQGMVVVALSWLIAAFLGAIPLYLSGHFRCFLDAYFDAMSGFATTGLTLIQDLDHLSKAHNIWRHLIMFLGGQGIVVFVISFLFSGASGTLRLYVGEARDQRVFPNVINTARFIWSVSLVYFFLGSIALMLAGIMNGFTLKTSLFEAVCLFMAAFDTGGFTPHSQSIIYYHSFSYEIITIIIMILGAINFKLHYELWNGNRQELTRNIEIKTFTFSVISIFCLISISLANFEAYPNYMSLFRQGFYQLISAHTGTGYQTIYGPQFLNQWSEFSLIALIIAMSLGGGICSTTGGIKMLRLGVIYKALLQDINRILMPGSSVVVEKLHHVKDMILEDKLVRSSLIITFCFFFLFMAGALIGTFLGYPFLAALFESTSASANVGLSCGITSPTMPLLLKLTYILQMWAGRLEFIAVFILGGFIIAFMKGR
ncbi:MAG: TrkH family potassium uptake protein [Gammaproteobacteria bacterium]|nr:TrkH family potassium uptake protein [Gammaproteobacteria bacterium]